MDKKLHAQITSILNDVDDMTIATQRRDGFPQATTVTFVNDDLSQYFLRTEGTQKTRTIDKNNKVSLTVNRDYTNWDDIEGLSMGTIATFVNDRAEKSKAGRLMLKKFPDLASYTPPNDTSALAYIRVDPKVLSALDYKKGFGHIEFVEL